MAFTGIGDAILEKFKTFILSKLNIQSVGKSFSPNNDTITDTVFKHVIVKASQNSNLVDLWNSNKYNTHYWLFLNTREIGRYFGNEKYCMKTYNCQREQSILVVHSLKIDYKNYDENEFGKIRIQISIKRIKKNGTICDK